MQFLLQAFFLLLPFGRLLSISLATNERKSAPVSMVDGVILALLVVYVLQRLATHRFPFLRTPGGAAGTLFAGWAALSLFVNIEYYDLNSNQMVVSGLYLVRWIEYLIVFFVVYEWADTRARAEKVVHWLVGGMLGFCIFGIVQSAFLPDFAFIVYPDARPYVDYDPQGHRLVSSLLDPNIAAGYILPATMLGASFMLNGLRRWRWVLGIGVIATILTLSRGGAVAFLAGFIYLLATRKFQHRSAVIAILAIAGLTLAAYPLLEQEIVSRVRFSVTDASALSRIEDWERLLRVIADNPVFGIGFNTLGFLSTRYGWMRDSASAFGGAGDLLIFASLTGIVGLAIYIGLLWRMFAAQAALSSKSNDAWNKAYGSGVQAAMIAVLVGSCFSSLLTYPQIMATLWVLWAVSYRLRGTHALAEAAPLRRTLIKQRGFQPARTAAPVPLQRV